MSYLEAVNSLLASIGEAPVNSIGVGLSESRLAQLTLDRVSRNVQKRGWYFNTETMTLYPDTNDEVQLPNNTLSVDTDSRRYVQRYGRLYDLHSNTYKFPQSVRVQLVLALEWDALPETVRAYITAKACMRFQAETVGSAQVDAELAREASLAYAELQEEEMEAGNYNMFDNMNLMSDAYLYRR